MPRRKNIQVAEGKTTKTNEDSYVFMSISRKSRKTWKPLKPSTMNFLTELMHNSSKKLLDDLDLAATNHRRKVYTQLLEKLTKKVKDELATVTAPAALLDYKEFSEHARTQRLQLQELKTATDSLEEQLEQLQLNKEECEKDFEQMELAAANRST